MDGSELKRVLSGHELMRRAYADDRFPSRRGSYGIDLRTFAVTAIWVIGIEGARRGNRWQRICDLLDMDGRRFWRTIEHDLPRWEPPDGSRAGACEAPMIRRDGPCGQAHSFSFRITNPADGTWHPAGFCSRHRDHAEREQRAERARIAAGGIPVPVPNTGGLLPCYLSWDWPRHYAAASGGTWKPPRVGVCADDWPVMAKIAALEPPSLALVHGDGEAVAGLPDGERLAPSLRLVRE